MPLGWIDFSKSERNKILTVLDMLSEDGTLDELGIAPVRDAFSNLFFPGTSTIQTRAKYFLIVPYALRDLERSGITSPRQFLEAFNKIERSCGERFRANKPDDVGIIGGRSLASGRWVKRTPADIYWTGLRTYGIFIGGRLSLSEYARVFCSEKGQRANLVKLGNRNDNAEENEADDKRAGDVKACHYWNIPTYTADWMDSLAMELSVEEAAFLKKQIVLTNGNSLFAYSLEHERKGIVGYPSFHSKSWLIRYVSSGEKREYLYRFVILSRNLTFDRSWDVSFYMDGHIGEPTDKNEPLADFLRYLVRQMPKNGSDNAKIQKMRSLIKELGYVAFDTGMKEFQDYEFLPNGIPAGQGGTYSVLDTPLIRGEDDPEEKSFHELLIMSPFLSSDIIRQFNERSRWMEHAEYVLITRAESLAKLKPGDCSRFEIYVLKDAVIDGEQAISGEGQDYRRQDIHAKLYMLRKGSDSDLYLGSLNASHNAVYGNIEFMVCLKSKNRYLNLRKLLDELFGGAEDGADNPFQRVSSDSFDAKDSEAPVTLDAVIKKLNRLEPYAEVEETGEFYRQTVFSEPYEDADKYDITLHPLLCNKVQKFAECMVFEKMALTELSEFYVLSVSEKTGSPVQRVIKIPTAGLPEEREQKIISSVIGDNPQNFYRYIAFLLGDNYVSGALDADRTAGEHSADVIKHSAGSTPALYEKMLQTAVNAPERFAEMERLVEAVEEDHVIPEEFARLYETFRKVVR